MSSILFVERKLRTDKLGILYLSSVLKEAGHLVHLVQDELDSAEAYLAQTQVDFVMYSVTTGEHRWYVQKNKELKKRHRFTSVVGGAHFTFFPELGISDPDIDIVVQGPGETVILDIVNGSIRQKLVKGHIPEDLNSLPAPDRSILYKYAEFGKARMKRFIAARDCPNACAYCFNHLYHKLYSEEKHRFFQRASPDKVIEEIKEVRQQYGLELAYFNDDDFAADHAWLDEFCAKYKSKVGLPFCGSIRANSVDYGLLKMMAEAGCVFLNIALESANIETQKLLRRGAITNQQIEEACRDCGQVGIMVRLQNMIGLPVEDPLKDALETLAFNMKINPTDSWAAIYQPFPKTELWEYCIKKGLVREDAECVNFHDYTILSIPDAEKLNRLHKWWFFAIKHQIPSELLAILLELPLTDEEETKLQDLRWRIAAQTLYGM